MNIDEALKKIKDQFGGKIKRMHDRSAKRVYIDIAREDLVECAGYMFKTIGARFNTTSGIDHPDKIELMYHFNIDQLGLIITLRTYAPKDDCVVDSLVPGVANAFGWIEREIHELLGVDFKGSPDLRPLLLPDDWPKGQYPLRKDYKLNEAKICGIDAANTHKQ